MKRMSTLKNILICPLDWGLGHATRCVPIIRELRKDFQVHIASSGSAAQLLKAEFPDLKHFSLPPYRITYPVRRSMSWHMAMHLPSLMATIIQEKKRIAELVSKHGIDLIISDNRFGAYSKKIPSVFISHQINIKTPHLTNWVNRLNHRAIKRFSHCWIPDFEKFPGLAGDLSHPPANEIKTTYIGPLSRFHLEEKDKIYDVTVVLSGPEPQRTILEDILFTQLFEWENLKINVVRGVYSSHEKGEVKNIQVYDHLESGDLEKMMHQSKNIICRSGYSGIMDLEKIQANVLYIPTPQQTEQEYLASLHSKKGNARMQNQDQINLKEFLEAELDSKMNSENIPTDFNRLVKEIIV